MKISAPVAIGVVVAALILIAIVGFFAVRKSTGADVADDIRSRMMNSKESSGPPVSAEQIQAAKQRGAPIQQTP